MKNKKFRNILIYFGLLGALTIPSGDSTFSGDCQKQDKPKSNLESVLKEDKRIVFNNLEVDSLKKVADNLLITKADSSDDYHAGVACYNLAELLDNQDNQNSSIGEFFKYLGNSRDSFLSAFEYYRNKSDVTKANESGINYLITSYSLLRNSLNAYQNNNFLKRAEEYKGRTDKDALDFWKNAAMFYTKFDEMYKGVNGVSFLNEVTRLEEDLGGTGHIGSYLKDNYSSSDSSSDWLNEAVIGFDSSNVNYLGSDFEGLHQRLEGLKNYGEFNTSLKMVRGENYIKDKYNGGGK